MNDTYYILLFVTFFSLLGIIAPLLNAEFNSDLQGNQYKLEEETYTSLTFWTAFGNLIVMPFWTFGLPVWLNFWILLPVRITFIFVIARNVWIGGGG